MRVLYVNHTGHISGGERSLLDVVRGVGSALTPMVACPPGPLVDSLRQAGVQRVPLPGTDGSLKLHPRHTPVALTQMARAALALRALARRHDVSLVHANSIRAGLVATMARQLSGPPTLVHLRDRLPRSPVSAITLRVLGHADALVANSRYTAGSLDEAGVRHAARVLANPVDLARFDPRAVDRAGARRALGLQDRDFFVVLVAQITPWKGQAEAIEAVAQLRARHDGVRLGLVGSAKFVSKATRYDNLAYLSSLERRVAADELGEHVWFLGERDDVPQVMRAADALLVPSWEEPFGRTVIEAMAMGLPVVATNVGGPAEILRDGVDGLLVAPRRPDLWAEAIGELVRSSELCRHLGDAGRQRATEFSLDAHVRSLLALYATLLERGPTSAARQLSSLDKTEIAGVV